MKRIYLVFLFVTTICNQIAFGQAVTVEDAKQVKAKVLWGGETQDAAYEAPNSSLLKKWFVPSRTNLNSQFHITDEEVYIQFFSNGTFQLHATDRDWSLKCSHEYILPGRWKRVHDELTLTYNFSQTKFLDKYEGLSMREKDNSIKSQGKYKTSKPYTWKCKILRMDDYLILDEFYYFFEQYTHYNIYSTSDFDGLYFVSEEGIKKYKAEQAVKYEEMKKIAEARAKEEQEKAAAAKKKAEEERLLRELQTINKQAYAFAHEGKYDQAISTINTVIEKQPTNANWYDSKGEFLYLKGDREGAKAMWDKVISLDPDFGKYNSVLNIVLNNQGWKVVNDDFSKSVPFKKIRVKKGKNVPSENCFAYFTTSPNSNPNLQNTNYGVNYFMSWIYNGHSYHDKKFKKCIDVGDGWFEYEYSQIMYFSHYQKAAPRDCLKILIE